MIIQFFKRCVLAVLIVFLVVSVVYAEDELWNIAVIDFENLTGAEELDWLSQGIPLSLNEDLKRVGRFRVVERIEIDQAINEIMFSLSDWADESQALDLSRQLAAQYMILGAYQSYGDSIQISTRVMDVESSEVLLSFDVTGPLEDIFELEDQIILRLLDNLAIALTQSQEDRIQYKPTESIEAYRLLLQGNDFFFRGDFESARSFYERALEADSYYSDAANNLGNVELMQGNLNKAKEEYERALLLNPDNGIAHYNLGIVLYNQGNMRESLEEYNKALEELPNHPDILNNKGLCLIQMEQYVEAWELYQTALELLPEDEAILSNAASAAILLGEWNEVIEILTVLTEVAPNNFMANKTLGLLMFQEGDFEKAKHYLLEALQLQPDYMTGYYYTALSYLYLDEIDEGIQFLQSILERTSGDPDLCYLLARFYAKKGNTDQALNWLNTAVNAGYNDIETLQSETDFDNIRSRERYQSIIQQMNGD